MVKDYFKQEIEVGDLLVEHTNSSIFLHYVRSLSPQSVVSEQIIVRSSSHFMPPSRINLGRLYRTEQCFKIKDLSLFPHEVAVGLEAIIQELKLGKEGSLLKVQELKY